MIFINKYSFYPSLLIAISYISLAIYAIKTDDGPLEGIAGFIFLVFPGPAFIVGLICTIRLVGKIILYKKSGIQFNKSDIVIKIIKIILLVFFFILIYPWLYVVVMTEIL